MSQTISMPQPALTPTMRTPSLWRAAAVALVFAILFLLLRTQQLLEVDGALRSLMVFHNPANRLHGNNHMLYPFWIWVWTRTAALAGFGARDWLEFVRQGQAMNAICLAAGIGMLYTVLETIAGARFALLGSAQFGLSMAVLLHGTNAAEPVVGLFFSLSALAVLLVSLRSESYLGLFLTGVLLALSLASYQSMILVAPMAAFACVCWPGTTLRKGTERLLAAGAGGLLGIVAIYGLAYARMGVPVKGMLHRFLTIDGAPQIYGGFSASKVVNVPFGLIRNLFHGIPSNYSGTRSLLKDPHAAFWICVALASLALLAAGAMLVAFGTISAVRRSRLVQPLVWIGIAVSAAALLFPAFYWGPTYDKLWLQPLAAISIASAFAFQFGGLSASQRKVLTGGLVALLLVEAAVNIPNAVQAHVRPTPLLKETKDFAGLVKPGDSVITDFDELSTLWVNVWAVGVNNLILPASTENEAGEWLTNAEKYSGARNGSLYFVSVLDESRTQWDAFLKRASGIPYSAFDCYRRESVVVQQYPYNGGMLTIRELRAPFACSGLTETPTGRP